MKNIKKSKVLKAICYIFVPILVLNIILNTVSLTYYSENEEDFVDYKNYMSTNWFANDYLSNIVRAIGIAEDKKEIIIEEEIIADETIKQEKELTTESDAIVLEEKKKQQTNIEMNFYSIKDYYILVISPEGNILTNVEKTINTDTVEEIKQYISNNKHFWEYDKQNIKTNIDKLQYEQIAYSGFEIIQESGCEIYTAVKDEQGGDWYRYDLFYNYVAQTYEFAPVNIIISSVLLILCMVYIFISIGHKEGADGIYTDNLDKIPYEIVIILASIVIAIEIIILEILLKFVADSFSKLVIDSSIMISILMGFIIYITLAVLGVTSIRRIKAHSFWKNTIVYKIFKFIFNGLFTNLNKTFKLALQYGGFIIISFALIMITDETPVMVLVLLAFWYYVFKKILNHMNQLSKVREKISKMYNGEIYEPLKEEELYGELKVVAKELNDISGGLSNAIEEATKSERLKTELITNVSHDIKTPLTSIINYVDLMKKENIENEKIQEYLDILDSKSQRLKKLTEDLIEASKASSGNIKLTMEKLNIKELIKQVSAEFEDKFAKRGLEIIETFPEEEVNVSADSRYLYRVMENIYANISKYALENSRVYIDVIKTKEKVQIVLKNISKDKLNISVDELMTRFVRGEESRTTEGSGLGISIAKSLTELQNGKFNIYLDGDLFKVVIEF